MEKQSVFQFDRGEDGRSSPELRFFPPLNTEFDGIARKEDGLS